MWNSQNQMGKSWWLGSVVSISREGRQSSTLRAALRRRPIDNWREELGRPDEAPSRSCLPLLTSPTSLATNGYVANSP